MKITNDPENYEKWKKEIEKHQKFDPSIKNICINHFESSDFEIHGTKKNLKKGAIPTIFDATNNDQNSIHDSIISLDTMCDECPILKLEVAGMKKELLSLKMHHDIEMQKLTKKIENLQKAHKNQ